MTSMKYHRIKVKGDPSAKADFVYKKNTFELEKEKGLREFWQGKVDDVQFVYTPSIMGRSNEITFLIFDDIKNKEKIEDEAWMEKAYWKVVNSIGAGDKWRKHLHKATAYNEYYGYKVKWEDDQISIKESSND